MQTVLFWTFFSLFVCVAFCMFASCAIVSFFLSLSLSHTHILYLFFSSHLPLFPVAAVFDHIIHTQLFASMAFFSSSLNINNILKNLHRMCIYMYVIQFYCNENYRSSMFYIQRAIFVLFRCTFI